MFRYLFLFLLAVTVFAFENKMGTTGYLRIQTTADDKKANVCFKAEGASTKYRLGNECETWLELGVYQDIGFDNGIILHNQVRPVFSGANNSNIDFVRFDEVYSEVFNVFDNSVSFWVGRRFYKRYDSHISDYFFFNMSGDGFGINNLDLHLFRFSYSFMFNRANPSTVPGDKSAFFQSHDLRLEKTFERGEMTLFINYMYIEGKDFNATQILKKADGYAFGVLYKDLKITEELFGMEGENITGLFYGQGLAKGAGSYSPYLQEPLVASMINNGTTIESSKTLRFINYNGFENETFGFMSNAVYEYRDDKKFSNTQQDWYSVGIRPYWFFHERSRLVFEGGYDRVYDRINQETHTLTKLTTALEFALKKGIWSRPVLRLYYTKAYWSANSKGSVGTDYYANSIDGDNIGIQLEYWW